MFSEPPFLQAKHPQPFFIRPVLQTFYQLHCPSMDPLQQLSVLLKLWASKLSTVLKVWPQQCKVLIQARKPLATWAHTASCSATVNQQPQLLFHQQPSSPKRCLGLLRAAPDTRPCWPSCRRSRSIDIVCLDPSSRLHQRQLHRFNTYMRARPRKTCMKIHL